MSSKPSEKPHPETLRPRCVKHVSPKMLEVLARDGFRCRYCGIDLLRDLPTFYGVGIDHVRPSKKKNRLGDANLVAACGACNHLKGNYRATSVDDAMAYVRARRVEFVVYFHRMMLHCGLQAPERPPSRSSLHDDVLCLLGDFAERSANMSEVVVQMGDVAQRLVEEFGKVPQIAAVFDHDQDAGADVFPGEPGQEDADEKRGAL